VFKTQRRYFVLGILIMLSGAVASQVGNYMTTYAIQTLKLPAALAQGSVLVGGVLTFLCALIAGALCDRYGRKVVNLLPRIALMLLIVPMFTWLAGAPSATTLLTVTAVLAALTAFSGAASLVSVPELMPIALRSTGVSLVYAIGTTLFGGTTQFIITGLLAVTHDPVSPAYYLAATSLVSLVAMMLVPETRDVDVSK
jgi:MFS family permease